MTKYRKIVRHTVVGPAKETISSKRWEATADPSTHTPVSAAVFSKVTADLSVYGDAGPQILSISSFDHDREYSCEIEIQLPGGVVMEVDYDTEDWHISTPATLVEASERIALLVSEFVGYANSHGFDRLMYEILDARAGLKKLFTQWSEDSDAHINLVDVRIPVDPWSRGLPFPPIQITIICLSEALLLEKMYIRAYYPHQAVDMLEDLYMEMKRRTQTKVTLGQKGADGIIDRIAMNALSPNGNLLAERDDYLLEVQEPYRLGNFRMKCGRMYLDATEQHNFRLEWCGDVIRIYDQMLPTTMCDSVCGKPITDLIMHPYLTSDIIIKKISYVDDPRADYIEIHIEQPRYFYCRGTGRYWVVG